MGARPLVDTQAQAFADGHHTNNHSHANNNNNNTNTMIYIDTYNNDITIVAIINQ